MDRGEFTKQTQAYDAATEAFEARQASRARAEKMAGYIPDSYLAAANSAMTVSLIARLERLYNLEVSESTPAVISSQLARESGGVDESPLKVTTINIGGSIVRVTRNQQGAGGESRTGYALLLDNTAPANVATELGGVGLGAVNFGDDPSDRSKLEIGPPQQRERQRLASMIDLAESLDVVEEAVGLTETPELKLTEKVQNQAWLSELLAYAHNRLVNEEALATGAYL